MLAEKLFIKNYNTTITVNKDGTTDVAVQADIQFLHTVRDLSVQLEHSASDESFGLSGRWLPGVVYYPVKNVEWSGGTPDKSDTFTIHLTDISSGDERTLTLHYTLEGNMVEDDAHPGFNKVLFSHKNLFRVPVDHAVTEIRLPALEESAVYEINTNPDFDTRQHFVSRQDVTARR